MIQTTSNIKLLKSACMSNIVLTTDTTNAIIIVLTAVGANDFKYLFESNCIRRFVIYCIIGKAIIKRVVIAAVASINPCRDPQYAAMQSGIK